MQPARDGSTTEALNTEDLVLGLECLPAKDSKMGPTSLFKVAAQAMGLCGIVNMIAG